MDAKEAGYHDEARESESFSDEYEGLMSGVRRPALVKRSRRIFSGCIPILILVSSLGLNIFLFIYVTVHRPQCVSLYAKLPENEINIPFHYSTEYGSENPDLEAKDELWNAIDISEGFVALTHEESDSLGLPRSKTFPWDANKGMYVSHGHHALHCTVLLHAYTYDAHRGKVPLVSYHHVEHCLDLIRQDIICHADDFMDFTAGHGDEFLTGDNQPRRCRDWNKLSEWVQQRSSCYKTVNITRAGEDHGVEHQLDRYTHCPKGSPYEPLIDAWRDLNRKNPGNLDDEGVSSLTDTDLKEDAKGLSQHNSEIHAHGA